MSRLVPELRRVLHGTCQVPPGATLVVAVSGGADSMALLHGLARIPARHRHPLVIAHLDHQLRDADSRQDALFVQQWAAQLGLPCHVESMPVRDAQLRSREGLETTARHLRHQFLARVALQQGARYVALAHHARDQAELFFLRLLRGSSPEGLGGMSHASPSPAEPSITLVRPLLDQFPDDLRTWLAKNRLPWREDLSNSDTSIPRNAIRHELFPVLERLAGPAIARSIARTMDLLRSESDYIDSELSRLQMAPPTPSGLPLPLQRRLVVRNLIALGHEPSHELVQHLATRPHKPRHLPGGLAVASSPSAGIQPSPPPPPPSPPTPSRTLLLKGQRGSLRIGNSRLAWSITLRRPQFPPTQPRQPSDVAWFDAHKLGRKITLRSWQPGDRFHPLGAPGSAKVGDLFTNRRIPRDQRSQQMVATTPDGTLAWVQGWPCGHAFRITHETQRFLRLQLFPVRAPLAGAGPGPSGPGHATGIDSAA